MSAKQLRIFLEDLDDDGHDEIFIELYADENDARPEFVLTVSSSRKDGTYDIVNTNADADGDYDFDEDDQQIYADFAKTAFNLLK